VKLTVNRSLRDKLEQARDWMRHGNPNGDLAIVLERAVDLLIVDLTRKQQGKTSAPRKAPSSNGKRVTRAARREVAARDGWRCSFIGDGGRPCGATAFLEIDHVIARGRGGSSRVENLRVLCRAYNRLQAERVYGATHVEAAIAARAHTQHV